MAPLAELTPIVAHRLGQAPDLLHSSLMQAAGWLRDAPATARWRSEVLRRLSRLLLDVQQPETLRATAGAALVASEEPSVAAVFKPGLNNPDPFTRRISALCLGALQVPSLAKALAAGLADDYLDVRWAAALALSATPHPTAIEALANGLLTGDDHLRRACAEALARNAEEGHPLLREALAHDDLLVRRAAVYGLAAAGAPWAVELLRAAQHTEMQWLVRSAIQEVLAAGEQAEALAPRPTLPAHALGWLAAWAAQRGEGVPPGPAAVNSLLQATREGDQATRRAAAEAIGWLGDPAHARELYPLLEGQGGLLAETAFRALAQIAAASGQRLAPVA
jgi:HEAT repeat protein